MSRFQASIRVARREIALLWRGRSMRGWFVLLVATAWLPPLLLRLRAGSPGLASFGDATALTMTLSGVVLPLIALLIGADLLAGEVEDGTIIPILTLPISRGATFAGKCVGRALLLGAAYLLAFGSVAGGILWANGPAGWQTYLSTIAAGLALLASGMGVGVLLGAVGGARIRAFGSALVAWTLLVFLLDALVLGVLVARTPPMTDVVGSHGHRELSATRTAKSSPSADTHARAVQDDSADPPLWIIALNPVDLYRLSVLAWGPDFRAQFVAILPTARRGRLLPILGAGWAVWLLLPYGVALWRFRTARLR